MTRLRGRDRRMIRFTLTLVVVIIVAMFAVASVLYKLDKHKTEKSGQKEVEEMSFLLLGEPFAVPTTAPALTPATAPALSAPSSASKQVRVKVTTNNEEFTLTNKPVDVAR